MVPTRYDRQTNWLRKSLLLTAYRKQPLLLIRDTTAIPQNLKSVTVLRFLSVLLIFGSACTHVLRNYHPSFVCLRLTSNVSHLTNDEVV